LLFGYLVFDLYREQFGYDKSKGNASVLDLFGGQSALPGKSEHAVSGHGKSSLDRRPSSTDVRSSSPNLSRAQQSHAPINIADHASVEMVVLKNLEQLETLRSLHASKLTTITSQMKKLHSTFKDMKKLLTVNSK
jgi:hypothetical protein